MEEMITLSPEIFKTALNAVLPVLLLSVLGYLLKKIGFLTKQFTQIGSKLVFHVCLCCTLFVNIYSIQGAEDVPWDVIIFCLVAITLLFLAGLCTTLLITPVPARRGVISHAIFRSNFAIIGLTLASYLGDQEAAKVASVVSAFAIPLYNVLGVISLSIFAGDSKKRHSILHMLLDVIKNPMILGAIAGATCILARYIQTFVFGRPLFTIKDQIPFVFETVNQLKTMTTPLALLVLGAQFEFSAVKGLIKEIIFGTIWRLILAPMLGIGAAFLLTRYTELVSFGVNDYPALIALLGSPVAVSTVVIATEMGGDDQLATQLVVWTSLLSSVTIYLTVCIMMANGLLAV